MSFSRAVGTCIRAADELAKEGISAEVINLLTIRPLVSYLYNLSFMDYMLIWMFVSLKKLGP